MVFYCIVRPDDKRERYFKTTEMLKINVNLRSDVLTNLRKRVRYKALTREKKNIENCICEVKKKGERYNMMERACFNLEKFKKNQNSLGFLLYMDIPPGQEFCQLCPLVPILTMGINQSHFLFLCPGLLVDTGI